MNGSRLSSQGRLSLSLALPLARRGPSHIHDRHTPQTLQCTVCAERAAHRFSVLSFRPRIPTNKYKGLKKRDLYVSADDNHRYIVHSLVCVCAMCFSRSLPATKASTGTAVCLQYLIARREPGHSSATLRGKNAARLPAGTPNVPATSGSARTSPAESCSSVRS